MDGVDEVVVADGGSRDATCAIVRGHGGARLVEAPRGRGAQMNAGAAASTGDVLWFVHADCRPPRDAAAWIARALGSADVVGGAFRTWHEADGGPRWAGPLLHLADVRSRVTRLPYGDQAVFVRRAAFEAVGGFVAEPMFEDVGLARRLWGVGRVVTVRASVAVSGRRFLARPVSTVVAMWTFPMLCRMGVRAETLVGWYGRPR